MTLIVNAASYHRASMPTGDGKQPKPGDANILSVFILCLYCIRQVAVVFRIPPDTHGDVSRMNHPGEDGSHFRLATTYYMRCMYDSKMDVLRNSALITKDLILGSNALSNVERVIKSY